MTLKLKDVGNMCSISGITPIKSTPMWEQDVETITPVQLYTFRARLRLNNQNDIADTVIEKVLSELQRACAREEIEFVEVLKYSITDYPTLTTEEFCKGLTTLAEAMQCAIIFGLEMKMPADDVTWLTWQRFNELQRSNQVSDRAQSVAFMRPRNLHCAYVFWQIDNGAPVPVTGIEMAVFDAYGMVWAELQLAFDLLQSCGRENNDLQFGAFPNK